MLAASCLWLGCPLWATDLQTKPGHVPRIVAGLRPLAAVESSRRLHLAIGLPLHDRDALTLLLEQLYDPASPQYRRFLTSEQFVNRFAPTEQEYQAVISFARSNGFVVTGRHANRMLLDVNASVPDIERALHLRLRWYQHPTESRKFYSPDVEPSVDAGIPILTISGLDDLFIPRPVDSRFRIGPVGARPLPRERERPALTPLKDHRGPSPSPGGEGWGEGGPFSKCTFTARDRQSPAVLDATGSGPAGTFLGRDFRAAYAPGLQLDGAGESIGLLELDSYYPGDVSTYEDLAGLPQVPLTNVLVNGFNRAPGSNNGEVALDIEMAISMAPGLSRVIVYEGAVANDILNRMATENQARQLSSSWSFGSHTDALREQIFQQFAAQGQSFFQASGDAGAYGPVFPPADDPFVTAVGGTALATSNPGGGWLSESAWFGSGGGISQNYPIPSWQKSVSMAANLGSTTMRNVPDVAALADATIWVIANNGEQGTVGGTSAAAPLWAGFAALVNQQAAASRQPAVGFLNPALYVIGQSPVYATAFHDITAGNNTNAASPNGFFATSGYDLCTGWGSPAGSNLVNALLAPRDALQISPVADVVFTGPVGGPFVPIAPAYTLRNLIAGSLSWSVGNASAWLDLGSTNGTLPSAGSSNTLMLTVRPAAANLPAASYPAILWFTNLNDGFVQRRSLRLDIVTAPVITTQPSGQSLPIGATAQFSIGVSSTALPSFQWQVNATNVSDSASTSGAHTSTLTLLNVTPAEAGTYSVRLSNAAGVTNSAGAVLMITSAPPVIVTQPVGQDLLPGSDAVLSVVTYGDAPLSYQWRVNGTNLADSAHISGSTSNMLTLTGVSASDSGAYSVIVSNALGTRLSSAAPVTIATLTTPEMVQETIYTFTAGKDGGHPNGLTRAQDQRLYGTTQTGGPADAGTIFRLTAGNQPSTLYGFHGISDGARPNGRLLQQTNGTWLGTTYGGGTNGFGTIFELRTNNQLTTLFTLDHTNGVLPTAGLTQTPDGSLFGTAYEGGIYHFGAVFRLDQNLGFSVLVPFNSTNGAFPHAELLLGSDGLLYGTTYKGGTLGQGTVFSLSPFGLLTTLGDFDGTNGAFPLAALTEGTDGTFYGVTSAGGVAGLGAVFRLSPDGVLSNVFSFSGGLDGSHPRGALLVSSDGNLYGTTSDGGTYGVGTIFRLSPAGSLTTISQFDGFNGANPEAQLAEANDASLYGATQNGGPANAGVIFRLSVPATAPQITSQPGTLTTYAGATAVLSVACIGSAPLSYQWSKDGVTLADTGNVSGSGSRVLRISNLTPASSGAYRVTVTNALGAVTSLPANLQVLVSPPVFTAQPTNQTLAPGATAVLSAKVVGDLPLWYHWQKNGTNVIDAGNVSGSTTRTLTLTNVTEANNGSYVLTVTNALGSTNSGMATVSVVPASAPGTRLATLYSFYGMADGAAASELIDGRDGYLYGTTPLGGAFREGTVFKLGTNGTFVSLLAFDQTNGAMPMAGLALGSNGTFYGTTATGGAKGSGTIFSFSPTAGLATLHAFTGGTDGGAPQEKVTSAPDGNLYGASRTGGQNGYGTIFKTDLAGNVTALHSFSGGTDGTELSGALLPLSSGDLYGLTANGGLFTNGSVVRITPAGLITHLYSFSGGADGSSPVGSLVRGDDGSLYGATEFNTIRGLAFYGTLFKLTPAGALSTLYSLNFSDGSYPVAGLVLADDGNFYGTTEQGGATSNGTVFRMAPDGTFTTLVEFDGFNDGANPVTVLASGPDGALYGTTSMGGPGGYGTLFRLSFTSAPQITAQPQGQNGVPGGAATFSVAVTGARPLGYQWQKDGTNLADTLTLKGSLARVLTLTNLVPADAGTYSVVITNPLGTVGSTGAMLSIQAAPPAFTTVSRSNGLLLVSWNTTPGRAYQLQSATNLIPGNWSSMGQPITASGYSLSASLSIGPGVRQFYRVVLLP